MGEFEHTELRYHDVEAGGLQAKQNNLARYVETMAGKIGKKIYDPVKLLRATSFMWQGVSETTQVLNIGDSVARLQPHRQFEAQGLVLTTSVDGRSDRYDVSVVGDSYRASCQSMTEMMCRRMETIRASPDAGYTSGLSGVY